MIRVNLVPQEILDREVAQLRTKQAAVLGAVLAVILAAVSVLHFWRAVSLESQYKIDKAELDRLQKIVAQVEELERTAAQVRARLNVIVDLMKYRTLYPRFMEDLVKTLPSGVTLTGLSTVGDQKGLMVTMTCRSLSSDDVAAILRAFEGSDRFKEPVLTGGISISGLGGESSFSMTVKYAPQPEKS
ncbi:MAG: PilN domain-containing protein [Elusimicrobiota bacterium]|jgi:type IV pilus assembly protein PilN